MTNPGTRYGRRTIIGEAPNNSDGQRCVMTRCDCGHDGPAPIHLLRAGRSLCCAACANGGKTRQTWPTQGEHCGHRPQCPADGFAGCRYHLPLYDLCALTVADLGGVSAIVIAELTGVTRQAVLATIETAGERRLGTLGPIWDLGFERGRQWHASAGQMTRRRS